MPNKELHYSTIQNLKRISNGSPKDLYFKGDKENENRYRLKQFLESL